MTLRAYIVLETNYTGNSEYTYMHNIKFKNVILLINVTTLCVNACGKVSHTYLATVG